MIAALLGYSRGAAAYPFMIEHQYTGCAQCHIDPSGGSALTVYGRAQSEILLRTHYPGEAEYPAEGPGKIKDFLFGAFTTPKPLTLQADVRGLVIPEPSNVRWILMQGDLRAGLTLGNFVAYGSFGAVSEGAEEAWFTSNSNGWNAVTREHWLGWNVNKHVMVRAGRMNLPFGIRTDEHVLYTRAATGTDINDAQQLGASVFFANRSFRGELMGIAGNFQLRPDDFRERGYSGYFTYVPSNNVELGVSSLLAATKLDMDAQVPATRMAHGVFTRIRPVEHLGLLVEADGLFKQPKDANMAVGTAVAAQVDWEATQGLHLRATEEVCTPDFGSGVVATHWGAVDWFLAPRTDLRLDAMYGNLNCVTGTNASFMGLAQLHFFL